MKLSTKATVFKRVSLLIGGEGKHVDWGGQALAQALLMDLAERQTKDGFRKHYKTSEIISKIVRIWNETQMDLLKKGLSSEETWSLINDQQT